MKWYDKNIEPIHDRLLIIYFKRSCSPCIGFKTETKSWHGKAKIVWKSCDDYMLNEKVISKWAYFIYPS